MNWLSDGELQGIVRYNGPPLSSSGMAGWGVVIKFDFTDREAKQYSGEKAQ